MRAAAFAVAVLIGACSTARPKEQDRTCIDESDCLSGQICSNNICYDNDLPPFEAIGLDVRTEGLTATPFRVEILGKDKALAEIYDRLPNRYYVERAEVRDRLRINLQEIQFSDLEAGKSTTAEVAATIELQQGSRLDRAPFTVSGLNFPPAVDGTPPADESWLVKSWPRYAPGDVDGDLPVYIKLTYQDDPPEAEPRWERGIVARQLMRKRLETASDHEFKIASVRECHRKVLGNIRFPEGPLTAEPELDSPATVTVNMRHAGRADDGDPETPICDPAPAGETPATCSVETVVNPPYSACSSIFCPDPYGCYPAVDGSGDRCGCRYDFECPKGQVCNVERQECALDLTDRPAIKPVTALPVDDAPVASSVYIYCDDDPTADRTMEFIVSATPDPRLGLPRLNYRVVLTFLVGDLMGSTPLGRVCLPTWERARTVSLPLVGESVKLRNAAGDKEWTCCDTACFDESTPPASTECEVKAEIGAVGNFAIADPATWEAAACMPLSGADENGVVRVTYPNGTCPTDSDVCSIALSPGVAGGNGQMYNLRIEPPVGSLFRSTTLDLTVTADSTNETPIELERRVLLRGRVSRGDCPEGACPTAEVLAERVIRGEDPNTLLGPYFYSAKTIPDTNGDYVIPVNPGLYLVSALPTVTTKNSDIGPAPIVVVDLREGSPGLVEENGVWVADIEDLVLSPGSVYTVELNDFDSSSRVVPLDVTTWAGLADPAGEPLDLNAPGTCQVSEGCQIRRIRSGSSPVRLPQDQIIRFVARAAAGE